MGASWDSGEQPAWLPSLLASDSSFRSTFAAYHFVPVVALQLLPSLLAFALLLGSQLSSLLLASLLL